MAQTTRYTTRRGPKGSLKAPNGQIYEGWCPESMPDYDGESPYIRDLAQSLKGICEVILPLGRADLATRAAVFEVEPVLSWRHGARQVLAYGAQTGWAPALALFDSSAVNGAVSEDSYRPALRLAHGDLGIDLWVWRGDYWEKASPDRRSQETVFDEGQPRHTLDEVAELTGFTVDALTRGCRRAERGEPNGVPHSKFAGARVMTRGQIEQLLANTEIQPELTAEQRIGDEVERRREAARRRVANRQGRRAAA